MSDNRRRRASNTPPQPEQGQAPPAAAPQPQPPAPQPQPQQIAFPPQILAQLLVGGLRPGLGVGGPIAVPVPGIVPVAQTQQTVQLWQGQYPPPDAVEHYEKVLPGSFDRMIAMAEHLQAAQIEEARRVNNYTHLEARRGHWLGFSAAGLAMVAALVSIALNYTWVAVAFISVPVMGVAKALIDSAKQSSPSDLLAAATGQGGPEGENGSAAKPPAPPST